VVLRKKEGEGPLPSLHQVVLGTGMLSAIRLDETFPLVGLTYTKFLPLPSPRRADLEILLRGNFGLWTEKL